MLKEFKFKILCVLIVLAMFSFVGTKVSAAQIKIDSEETLKEAFKEAFDDELVAIEGTTITFKGNVTFEGDVIEFCNGEYELNLQNCTLTADELYAADKSDLTINAWGGMISGKIESYFGINEGATVTINNGKYRGLHNNGNLVINYGEFENIIYNGPKGNLTIEDGKFGAINQEGTAKITGGIFNFKDGAALNVYIDTAQTNIVEGFFETVDEREEIGAITINSTKELTEDVLNKIVEKGSKITYDKFVSTKDKYGNNVACYNNVKIVKVPENYEEKVSKLIPDGKTITLKSVKPSEPIEVEFYTAGMLTQAFDSEGFRAYIDCWDSDSIYEGKLVITSEEYKETSFIKEYPVQIVYQEPEANDVVEEVMNKIVGYEPDKVETYYQVTDLGLINYYMSSAKPELWKIGSAGVALKYSKDIIEVSDGGNIQFILDNRLGGSNGYMMHESAGGGLSVMYNGYMYGLKSQGLCLKRVIYIPQDTADTPDAYVAAAQKRINDYLGTDDVVVEYGAPLSTLSKDYTDDLVDVNTTDGNYYNITIKGITYRFYIIKGTNEDMIVPEYRGKDIATNITVTTDKAEVPLDTEVTAKPVQDKNIEKVLGTDNYKAYDIKLFSNGRNSAITKLENGKFLVSIPVGNWLEGKKITVYYINSNNERQEHLATVKDGIVSFETDHFSTYVLAERVDGINNPNTSDSILIAVSTLIVSMAGVVVAVKCIKK